jgi:hypothetical protein
MGDGALQLRRKGVCIVDKITSLCQGVLRANPQPSGRPEFSSPEDGEVQNLTKMTVLA